jgi:cytochrome c-type biogenesis protein CcmF
MAGPAALAVALAAAAAAVVLALRGRKVAAGRSLAVSLGGLSVALVVLALALVRVDGTLVYVADHTSRATSWPYRLAAVWGGMAGSLLLWTWMAAAWAVVAGVAVRRRAPALAGGTDGVFAAYLVVFCALLVFVSNPFDRLDVPAIDGGGLNPVLLHPAMLYHPPLLYAGAVGLLVPFAFAMAGPGGRPRWMAGPGGRPRWLTGRRTDVAWLTPAARFAGVSLVLLSAGLLAGAHWAYVELGWGGYWAWDPVENGGLLPWLGGVAFLHAAVAARRQRGSATAARGLAGLAFLLGLLGSFLTRSGASESVHAFAEARAVGWVLGLALAGAAVAAVVGVRRGGGAPVSATPRLIGANNVLLVALVVVIGFGTVYPVLAGDGVIVTGRYFALVAAPLALAVLFLLAVAPGARRRSPPVAGLVAAGVAGMWFAEHRPVAVLMAGLAGAAGAHTIAAWRRRPRARWPLAHLGVSVLLAGVAGTTTGTLVTAPLSLGDAVTVRGFTLQLVGVQPAEAPDGGRAARATLTLRQGDDALGTLRPVALVSDAGQRVSVAALRSTPLQDVQVALRAVGDGGQAVIVEIGVHPLMQLVWWGGLLVVAGLGWSSIKPRPADETRASGGDDGRQQLVQQGLSRGNEPRLAGHGPHPIEGVVDVVPAEDEAVSRRHHVGPQGLHRVDVAVVDDRVEPLVPRRDQAVEHLEAVVIEIPGDVDDVVDGARRDGGEGVDGPQHAGALVVEGAGGGAVEDRGEHQA